MTDEGETYPGIALDPAWQRTRDVGPASRVTRTAESRSTKFLGMGYTSLLSIERGTTAPRSIRNGPVASRCYRPKLHACLLIARAPSVLEADLCFGGRRSLVGGRGRSTALALRAIDQLSHGF